MKEAYRVLKDNGTIYVCCDWKSSPSVYKILQEYFKVQNRITWARDKGRGSNKNWKNNIEDIYFATKNNNYKFYANRVKILKKVLAPYTDEKQKPKDWFIKANKKYRLTSHSNIWTDITVPFWSMFENTEHPTQKPEKLIAKLILASSDEKDIILDPFLGSGTTSVVAKKLNRKFIGIEMDKEYCHIAIERLKQATTNKKIQGYNGEFFLDKN